MHLCAKWAEFSLEDDEYALSPRRGIIKTTRNVLIGCWLKFGTISIKLSPDRNSTSANVKTGSGS